MPQRIIPQRPTVEQLESRDLACGDAGFASLPGVHPPAVPRDAAIRSLLPAGAAAQGAGRWDRVLLGTWYVPPANLLAYLYGPLGANPLAIGDETVFHITSAKNGVFSGTTVARLFRPTGTGDPDPTQSQLTMSGVVTPRGRIRISFTSTGSDTTSITGLGNMEFVGGAWRMTMQMSTSVGVSIIHWAYMTHLGRNGQGWQRELRSTEWRWLFGTRWAIEDSQFFAGGPGAFHIDGYRNGYFWGAGASPSPFTVIGSVTPEGRLFLALISPDSTIVTRTGELEGTAGGSGLMRFRAYEGTAAVGTARRL